MATKAQEETIRAYLQYLQDPSSIIDADRINELEGKLSAATDPIERVALRQELEQARAGDETAVRDGFVTHAKAWAENQRVSASAFEAEGVPREVLAEAGLVPKSGRRRRSRGPRVTTEDVRKALPKKKTQGVTVNSLAAKTGASVGTVRNVLKEEVEAGRLQDAGPDPEHSGPGRAPTIYKKAS